MIMLGRSFYNLLVVIMKNLEYCEVLIFIGEKYKLSTLKEPLLTLLG